MIYEPDFDDLLAVLCVLVAIFFYVLFIRLLQVLS